MNLGCERAFAGLPGVVLIGTAVFFLGSQLDLSASFAAGPESEDDLAPRLELGLGVNGLAYVDEAGCRTCHPEAAQAWRDSHHKKAMQRATPETVLARFDGQVEFEGDTFAFEQREGRFFVKAAGADGVVRDHEVLYTFGVDPLQQYLVAAPGGRLQPLRAAWDVSAARWFDVSGEPSARPGDAFHWTGRYQNWNSACADCHSTHLRKNYDPETDRYATRWSALEVGCQACHGPGAAHVEWAEKGKPAGRSAKGLAKAFAMQSARAEVETCAPCHARRADVSGGARDFDALLDDYVPSVLEAGLYFPDGQIREEVYVYGSFAQSKMYAAGVRCSDCHEPHGLGPRQPGNALCTQCHAPEPSRDFGGLAAGVFDDPAHHHHPAGSAGAQCVSCHMPERTYMVVDPRRDHSMKVPRPDLARVLGVPDPCTSCHPGESEAWAEQQIERWYGAPRRRDGVPARAFHDAVLGDPGAIAPLVETARDAGEPGIVRATAVSLLPRYGRPALPTLLAAVEDPDALVRLHATAGLSDLPGPERLRVLRPLLGDARRAVRAEAGRALADVPDGVLDTDQQRRLDTALAEYEASQRAQADLPMGRMNLALLYSARGDAERAAAQYRQAILQDPQFMPPVANLAQLLHQTGQREEAERVLAQGIERMPEEGELHYSLGLVRAESGRIEDAVAAMERAADLLPDRPRIHYNLALALQHLGQRDRAAEVLERVARGYPNEPDFAKALAILYLQQERYAAARDEAQRWLALVPESPEARNVLAHAKRGLAASRDDAPR